MKNVVNYLIVFIPLSLSADCIREEEPQICKGGLSRTNDQRETAQSTFFSLFLSRTEIVYARVTTYIEMCVDTTKSCKAEEEGLCEKDLYPSHSSL